LGSKIWIKTSQPKNNEKNTENIVVVVDWYIDIDKATYNQLLHHHFIRKPAKRGALVKEAIDQVFFGGS
jgi:hypothetical protein